MKILLKCPTRSRPHKIIATLRSYIKHVNRPDLLGVAISCDINDETMTRNLIQEELHRTLAPTAWHRIFFSRNTSKIEACNANMSEIDWPWDIVVLVSDDMIPQIQGYDDVIRNHMSARFPDTNGILWCNDGIQGQNLNTLSIYGRTMYNYLGCMYRPEYKSLFCDGELTDLCKTTLADKCLYIPTCIIRHEHPQTGFPQTMDALYARNQTFWNEDMFTYIRRKSYPHDITYMIPTIPGREASLARLIASIHEKMSRIAPTLRYTIDLGFDNREMSIGSKRQMMIQRSLAKYSAFIDDDDEITDAYIEDLRETIAGSYHVMRLRGTIHPYTFTHSIENTLSSPMARGEVFLRPPNHLNPMMTDVAKFVHFRDAVRGEDLDWTMRMAATGSLTQEYTSDLSRIHYVYNMGTRTVHPETLARQHTTSYETMLSMVWTSNGAAAPTQSMPAVRSSGLRLGPKGFVSA